MKGRFFVLGALCAALAAFAAIIMLPDAALAAPITHSEIVRTATELGWLHTAVEASPLLLSLRSQLKDVTDKAEAKMREVTDGMAADAIRAIEQEHGTLVSQAEGIRSQIAAEEARIAAVAPQPAPAADATRRASDMMDIGQRAGIDLTAIRAAVDNPAMTVEAFRSQAFDTLVSRQTTTSHIRVDQDATETRRLGMEEAVARSINPEIMQGEWSERASPFRDMSLVDMAAERLGVRRVGASFAQREDVLRRAMHTTSDFPILLENAVNRNLTARYALAQPTYRQIAVRDDFNDFRPHTSVSIGDFPLLQPIAEAGKIQFGTIGEKKETVAVVPYAIGLAFSRQLLVNDSLRGLDRVIASYGQSVALFEEKTFYAMKALNSGAGPTLLEGSAAMFAAARGNLAGSGGAISVTTVSAARAAMRGYKSIDGNELLFNAPSILLVGPAKETEAEQFVTTLQPVARAEINPFQGKLTPLVSQMITGNAWELYTAPSVRANFRWGLLSGYTAPRVRIDEPFGTQGAQMSVEHDFGCGGQDWRAGYRNPGN